MQLGSLPTTKVYSHIGTARPPGLTASTRAVRGSVCARIGH